MGGINPIKLLPFLPFLFSLQQAKDQGLQIAFGDISDFAMGPRAVTTKT